MLGRRQKRDQSGLTHRGMDCHSSRARNVRNRSDRNQVCVCTEVGLPPFMSSAALATMVPSEVPTITWTPGCRELAGCGPPPIAVYPAGSTFAPPPMPAQFLSDLSPYRCACAGQRSFRHGSHLSSFDRIGRGLDTRRMKRLASPAAVHFERRREFVFVGSEGKRRGRYRDSGVRLKSDDIAAPHFRLEAIRCGLASCRTNLCPFHSDVGCAFPAASRGTTAASPRVSLDHSNQKSRR